MCWNLRTACSATSCCCGQLYYAGVRHIKGAAHRLAHSCNIRCVRCDFQKTVLGGTLLLRPAVLLLLRKGFISCHYTPDCCTSLLACCCRTATAGLQQLRQLSLGWCRDLGDTSADASNSVAALACLSRLSSLSLAGTRADDAQLVALLPRLQQLQVRVLRG